MERETAKNPPPEPGSRPGERLEDPPGPGRADALQVDVLSSQAHLAVDPDALAALARRVLVAEGIERAAITIALVDDAAIHAMNRRHLDHDWPTDVITFRLSEPDDPALAADLVVSAEMASATARDSGLDPQAELALYVVHGLLHLCGFDDLSAEAAEAMRRREAEHLAREGITNTFAMVGPSDPPRRGGAR